MILCSDPSPPRILPPFSMQSKVLTPHRGPNAIIAFSGVGRIAHVHRRSLLLQRRAPVPCDRKSDVTRPRAEALRSGWQGPGLLWCKVRRTAVMQATFAEPRVARRRAKKGPIEGENRQLYWVSLPRRPIFIFFPVCFQLGSEGQSWEQGHYTGSR